MTKTNNYDFYRDMAHVIAEHQRQLIAVPRSKTSPGFIYTVGNQEKALPELLLIGVTGTMVSWLVNDLCNKMVEARKPFKDGEEVSVGGDYPVKMYNADKRAHVLYTIQAGQFYGNEDYHVQQVVLCDKKGRWPDDPLCHKDYRVPVLRPS